jgi:hypothetical protein
MENSYFLEYYYSDYQYAIFNLILDILLLFFNFNRIPSGTMTTTTYELHFELVTGT